MAGIIPYGRNNPSLNVCGCSLLLLVCGGLDLFRWGSGHFQVNELYTRKLGALPAAYTLPNQNYKSL